jgi:hypothetical protein
MQTSELDAEARQKAQQILTTDLFPAQSSLRRQRAFVRTNLKSTMKEIDKLAVSLLKGI